MYDHLVSMGTLTKIMNKIFMFRENNYEKSGYGIHLDLVAIIIGQCVFLEEVS